MLNSTARDIPESKGAARLSVLHVAPTFYPATRWGGPIFSTKAICDGIVVKRDLDLRVLTTDAAGPLLSDTLELPKSRILTFAGYEVKYFHRALFHSFSPTMFLALPRAIQRADVVHVTGTYSAPTLPVLMMARLLRCPVVWSPRGAIQASEEWSGASRQRSKRAFEYLARRLAPSDTVLHVTAKTEADATTRRMPGLRTVIIPNSVSIPSETAIAKRRWRPDGRLRLLSLGRVHEKKGIDLLIDAMAQLPSEVELDVFGTGEPDYLEYLKVQSANLGLESRVRFLGHADDVGKGEAFRNADIFVLPSHSENFGIAVAEALANGLPVVTTQNTPWADLDSVGCGRCINLSSEQLVSTITEMGNCDLESMGALGRNWVIRDFSPDAMNSKMLRLYYELVSARANRQRT